MSLEKAKLDNGLTLYVDRVPNPDGNSVMMHVPYGSVDEKRGEEGSAHALEHCVHIATEEFPRAYEIDDFSDEHNLNVNANTHGTRTVYWANGADLEPNLFYLSQILQHARLPRRGVEQEMKIVRREAKVHLDDIDTLHMVAGDNAMFGASHGRQISGYHNRLHLGKDRLQRIYQQQYGIGRMALVVVGNANLDEVVDLAEQYFLPDDRPDDESRPRPNLEIGEEHTTGFVREESHSVRVRASYPISADYYEEIDKNRLAYDVAVSLMSDLSYRVLRYSEAIAYGSSMTIDRVAHPDAQSIYGRVVVDDENAEMAAEILSAIPCFGSSQYNDSRIDGMLSMYKDSFRADISSVGARADAIIDQLAEFQEPKDYRTTMRRLDKTNVDDVEAALDAIAEYTEETAQYVHLTGPRAAIGDVDRIIELDEIA